MSYLHRIDAALARIDAQHLRRTIREHVPGMLDFSSNDYLGLSQEPELLEALRAATRAGSGGARLLAGAYPEHAELEAELAALVRRESALLFSSGYLAALGAIGALAHVASAAYSDELNHACLIDGLRLTKLERTVFPHRALPPRASRTTPALVVSETIFGMDGDAVDVEALVAALHPEDILILDEAHALGVAGPQGGGLAANCGDPRVVVMGTLSKAFGTLGGFVAGPERAIEYLRNAARAFIFDTSLPPPVAAAGLAALRLIARGQDRRDRLVRLAAHLRARLREWAFAACEGTGAVVPIPIGDAAAALAASRELEVRGIRVPAIRPPTVPVGTSRLRVTLRADHSIDDIERLVEGLRAVLSPQPASR